MRKPKGRKLGSIFGNHIAHYMEMRRRMGYRFGIQSLILSQFDWYLSEMGYQGPLTQDLVLNFAKRNSKRSKTRSALMYRVVRQFSVYLSDLIPDVPVLQKTYPIRQQAGRLMDRKPQSVFANHIANYIALKKGMGYLFTEQELILLQFDRHLDEIGYQGLLTQELALNFATSIPRMSKNHCVKRYQVIRHFADYLAVFMPDTPPLRPDVLVRTKGRTPAHIFNDEEMMRLMDGARRVSRVNPLRNITLHAMIGLVASTGLRVGEVVRLDRDDVNLETGVLTIRRTKFQKDRLVSVHPTTLNVLRDYVTLRDARFSFPATPAFFIQMWGRRFAKRTLSEAFHDLASCVGVRTGAGFGPSIHDLRHTFAVRRLVAWYREGKDVQAMLPLLATYMGHVDFSNTAYYLTATGELLGLAAERYDAFMRKED